MLASLRRLKEGHHAFEASMGRREEGSREQEKREGERETNKERAPVG